MQISALSEPLSFDFQGQTDGNKLRIPKGLAHNWESISMDYSLADLVASQGQRYSFYSRTLIKLIIIAPSGRDYMRNMVALSETDAALVRSTVGTLYSIASGSS